MDGRYQGEEIEGVLKQLTSPLPLIPWGAEVD